MVYTSLVQPMPSGSPGFPGQAAYDMGWGDAEGNCLPRGVIKTTFFGSIRWVGFFLEDAGKLKKKAAIKKVHQRGTLCLHSWC